MNFCKLYMPRSAPNQETKLYHHPKTPQIPSSNKLPQIKSPF